jgi:gamma-glutamyltranspeptidase/glutathione hydrolase
MTSAPHDLPAGFPPQSVPGARGAVASADDRASRAGLAVLTAGGNAVDASIATNAVMAVVGPHLCGLGGDLFALVHHAGTTYALNASGRAGAGADAAALRGEGHAQMPFRDDVRTVTVPGCVDGWAALHARFGSLPLPSLLQPAIDLAEDGFTASPSLSEAVGRLDGPGRQALAALRGAAETGHLVLPGVARTLRAIATDGRAGFYDGEFGAGLLALGAGLFDGDDLTRCQAEWVTPLSTTVWGVDLHTIPPNSQGYLALGAARLAERLGLPGDPEDPAHAHLLIECATAAGIDRPAVLHEYADGDALLAAIDHRAVWVDPEHAGGRLPPTRDGDTTYLCVVDSTGCGVSLIQSNAAGFGSLLAEPNTGINLHNRGLGFSLAPGHPAEFAPGRRPPHTLAPLLATRDGALAAVLGTMGGDAQPQILLQLLARLFVHQQSPHQAITAGRWALRGSTSGFETWSATEGRIVQVEGQAPHGWDNALTARGHRTERLGAFDSTFGHAHAIVRAADGALSGYADPRTGVGSCAAL